MDALLFFDSPAVTIATNTFIDVPVILQYENTPLIEVIRTEKAGFTTQIPIFDPDGTYLAKVVGSRLFTTEAGDKAGLILKYPKNMTVCELKGKPLFEIHRIGAAALRATAELYTPDGAFVKCSHDLMPKMFKGVKETALNFGGIVMSGTTIRGFRIGIWMREDGSIGIGVN
jgi:hypothetical protein